MMSGLIFTGPVAQGGAAVWIQEEAAPWHSNTGGRLTLDPAGAM